MRERGLRGGHGARGVAGLERGARHVELGVRVVGRARGERGVDRERAARLARREERAGEIALRVVVARAALERVAEERDGLERAAAREAHGGLIGEQRRVVGARGAGAVERVVRERELAARDGDGREGAQLLGGRRVEARGRARDVLDRLGELAARAAHGRAREGELVRVVRRRRLGVLERGARLVAGARVGAIRDIRDERAGEPQRRARIGRPAADREPQEHERARGAVRPLLRVRAVEQAIHDAPARMLATHLRREGGHRQREAYDYGPSARAVPRKQQTPSRHPRDRSMRPTRLRGARTNNLQRVDLDLHPGTLVVIAGPSGSGKSSLAFGTLYAEGQRRYVESFSAYARQFLERLARPPVDELEPVSAGIAVDRQAPVRTSRSTVGTMTEITDYAKGIFARIARLHCPGCGRPVTRDAPQDAVDEVLAAADGARVVVTYPVGVSGAEQFLGVREALLADGYRRVRVGEQVRDSDQVRPSDVLGEDAVAAELGGKSEGGRGKGKGKGARGKGEGGRGKGTGARSKRAAEGAAAYVARLDVVADRAVARAEERGRLIEAIEAAMERGAGRADVAVEGHGTFRYSRALHCAHCDRSFRDATPAMFSFNSPIGACETCRGFGRTIGVDWARVIPDERKTLEGGAIRAWSGESTKWERRELAKHAKKMRVPMDVPFEAARRPRSARGSWTVTRSAGRRAGGVCAGGFSGWRAARTRCTCACSSRAIASTSRAATCGGTRLKPEASWFRVDGHTIGDFYRMPVARALALVDGLLERHGGDPASALALRECGDRLRTLGRRRARATSRSIARRARCAAARRSAWRSRARSARRSRGRCSCSTSRRWGCTRATCCASSAWCGG